MTIFKWLLPSWVIWAALIAIGAGAGWTAQGWRKDAAIAELRREQADQRADAAEGALSDLVMVAKDVRTAATEYVAVRNALTAAMSAISKDLKHVQKQNPLPADCRPDAGRLRSLQAAVAAANAAATGARQQFGGAVPGNSVSAK